MALNLEKLYGFACDNLKTICFGYQHEDDTVAGSGEELYEKVLLNPSRYSRWYPALSPAIELWATLREELAKSKGGTAYTAMKRIVKNVGYRSDLAGAWIDSSGRQCVCDGYRAVRLHRKVGGLAEVTGMELDKVFPDESVCTEVLALPTPGELKICIAEQKGKNRKFYDFGGDLPRVNAEYLKDILDILPDAEARCDPSSPNRPILLRSEAGDAVLLPVHKTPA